MSEPARESKRVRLFVALELPARVRSGIATWGKQALRDPALRPVGVQSLHLTLVFLGHRDERQVGPIAAVVEQSGGPAPTLVFGQPEQRPLRGRARVFALPVSSEGTIRLQADLVARLAAQGLLEPEGRPFWPHVTVARVRAEGGGSRRPAAIEQPPAALPQDLVQPFRAVRLVFYRSELKSQSARYVPLAQVELPEAGWQ